MIIGIGRNFAKHAKELGNALQSTPILFLKPPSSIIYQPALIQLPKLAIVHHELELGVFIGKTGRDIKASNAHEYIAGYCLGLDMTARNFQDAAKKEGLSWTIAKGYDTFTPLSDFIPKSKIRDVSDLILSLKV
jgi:acylpyruvate hydrolase